MFGRVYRINEVTFDWLYFGSLSYLGGIGPKCFLSSCFVFCLFLWMLFLGLGCLFRLAVVGSIQLHDSFSEQLYFPLALCYFKNLWWACLIIFVIFHRHFSVLLNFVLLFPIFFPFSGFLSLIVYEGGLLSPFIQVFLPKPH